MENNTETTFWLLRHGQTVSNRTGYFQGWHDSPLDENGMAQIAAAAEFLSDRHFDAVFCSDLGRTRQTVDIVCRHHKEPLSVQYDQALREWNLGVYDGAYQPDLKKSHPEFIRMFINEHEVSEIPGGESRMEFQRRVENFFIQTAKANPGREILIVTHGGVFQRIFRMVSGDFSANNRLPLPTNASLSKIRFIPEIGGWQLMDWNIRHYLNHLTTVATLAL